MWPFNQKTVTKTRHAKPRGFWAWLTGATDKQFRRDVVSWLAVIYNQGVKLMATLDDLKKQIADLTAKVSAETTVETSLVTLLTGLVAQIKDLSTQLADAIAAADPVKLQEASDALAAASAQLDANIASMTQAVQDNIVPEPAPPAPVEG